MSDFSFMARWFLISGGALAVTGLVLWLMLPIKQGYPPYLPSALFALGYGAICLMRSRRGGGKS